MAELPAEIVDALKERFRHRDIEDMGAYIESLRTIKQTFEENYEFKSGDLVIWKQGLKNKVRPALNEPAIVMEVLTEPLKDDNKASSGTPYFNEPLDLALGILDDEGDFVIFYYDQRRFKPYVE